ncbi:MAG TPA: hypothetical protein PKK11_02335 [Methanothrix sp.]|nr:hypothetical protein [Methanothrix sp.]HPT20281.1 hypothetical protein [Methanothrix sp.]
MFRPICRDPAIWLCLALLCLSLSSAADQASDENSLTPSSKSYVPPPGIMPIVVLQGDPYQMGYQYGQQAGEYIAIVRDAAWASALSANTTQEIRAVQLLRGDRDPIPHRLVGRGGPGTEATPGAPTPSTASVPTWPPSIRP